jgi:hypothetical protein
VLSSPHSAADDASLHKLAWFLGLEVFALQEPPPADTMRTSAVHIAATCASLEAFQRRPDGRAWLKKCLAIRGSSMFVTGLVATRDADAIAALLPGVVDAVEALTDADSTYTVARHPSAAMREFAGLTFGPIDRQADRVLTLKNGGDSISNIIGIDGRPCFVNVEQNGTSYFLLSCSRVLDLDEPARREQPIDRFLHVVPFLAYLRRSFGTLCWRNPAPSACFIVDDPLLKERYGFLDLNRLESRMTASPFSVNIAFIPWNCRRTDRRVVDRFRRPDRRFSISVHGCDHTESEFSATDERWLRSQSHRALARMEMHERLTGIRHNRVMVFPQGVFSVASLQALGDAGFLAAVNSTIYPTDAAPDAVTFRDLMETAVVRFGGVPLILRHYPDRLENIALDLFLGRQVLIVEHHGFFRHGYEQVERCVAFVNGIAQGINWTDLEEVCTSACLVRDAPHGDLHVRAFGCRPHLRNDRDRVIRVRVVHHLPASSLAAVSWNDREIPFVEDGSGAACDLRLLPHERGVLSFHRAASAAPIEELTQSAGDRVRVFARRVLSEIRDNYLDRSPMLSEFARRGKALLPRL